MKLEQLAIIFVIIILPIMMVLSEYIDNRITMAEMEVTYDEKLLTATYDAVKAFQINTISNSLSDVTNSKIEDIEAAAKTFYNMAASNFNFNGYRSTVMQEYVPALVFTLYDGYYIYGPFNNTLTGIENPEDSVSEEYQPGNREGLKPYVYYSCRYNRGSEFDVVITYTLDNFITVQGTINELKEDGSGWQKNYVNKSGYLLSGVTKNSTSYSYDGIEFSETSPKEALQEYIDDTNTKYPFVKINGTKYYMDESIADVRSSNVFSIQPDGTRNYSQIKYDDGVKKEEYRKAIKENKSAYEYYKNAYEFTNWVNNKTKLNEITIGDAVDISESTGNVESIANYFGEDAKNTRIFDGSNYELSSSNFNQHRQAVIRHSIETNLSVAIASFSSNAGGADFIMPKISEEDWELIQNNVCLISFLQGIKMGSRKYNGYAVVQNSLSREYIDENDIYICYGNKYYRANDSKLNGISIPLSSGRYKLDFEMTTGYKEDGTKVKYCPMGQIYGSYSSIVGSSGVSGGNAIGTPTCPDMYTYMNKLDNNNATQKSLKKEYYTALGRERWGSYHVSNDVTNDWFLEDYKS